MLQCKRDTVLVCLCVHYFYRNESRQKFRPVGNRASTTKFYFIRVMFNLSLREKKNGQKK